MVGKFQYKKRQEACVNCGCELHEKYRVNETEYFDETKIKKTNELTFLGYRCLTCRLVYDLDLGIEKDD